MSDEVEEEDAEWQSGPFCQHYGDPGDCDEPCVCGHTCAKHHDDECDVTGCSCQKWAAR